MEMKNRIHRFVFLLMRAAYPVAKTLSRLWDRLLPFAREINVKRLQTNFLNYRVMNELLEMTKSVMTRMVRKCERMETFYGPPAHWPACNKPFNELVVNCDGLAYCGTCSRLTTVGDLNKQGIWDVWNGEVMQRIRRCMLRGSPAECKDCRLYWWKFYENKNTVKNVFMDRYLPMLIIEPTILCNLDCPLPCGRNFSGAYSDRHRRNTSYMSMDLFRKIIDQIEGYAGWIGFYNYGEPFLHPNIAEMISYSRQKCPKAYLYTSTSGMPLAKDSLLQEVLGSGIDEILFSVDGAFQESYEKYRRGGDINAVLGAMKKIVRRRKTDKPKVTWRYILFSWNDSDHEMKKAQKTAMDIGVDHFCYHLSDVIRFGSRRFVYGKRDFDYIAPFLYETERFIYDYDASVSEKGEGYIRIKVRNTGNIRWNSIERPWERYVYCELFGINDKGTREILEIRKPGRDINPGEEFVVQFDTTVKNIEKEFSGGVYFDCVLNKEFRFEDRKGGAFAVSRKSMMVNSGSTRM